jgi:uncharacterized protein with NRDE domain
MCIAALATECCEEFPFVFVHNREENWGRAATDAAVDDQGIICGLDAVAGGGCTGLSPLADLH